MTQNTPWWGRGTTLWLLLAPLCAVLYTLTTTISPHDFWWHAAAGRLMAETGRIPAANHFAWPLPESAPYIYQNWLAEWLIYKALQWGGLSWIALWRSAAVGLAFLIIGWAAYRRALRFTGAESSEAKAAAARWVAISLFLSLAMIALNLDARPQTFVLPLYAVIIWLLFALPERRPGPVCTARMVLGVTVLTALWANMHGSFFLVALALLAALGGEAAYAFGAGPKLRAFMGEPVPRAALLRLALLAACGALAVAANPLGFGIFSYVARLSGNSTVQKYMYEWQAPSLQEGGSIVFFLSPLLLLLMARIAHRTDTDVGERVEGRPAWLGRLGMRPGELLLLALLFAMGCRNIRSILWYALLFPPVFAPSAARAFALTGAGTAATWVTRRLNAAALAALLLFTVLLLPRVKPSLPWPDAYRMRFAPTPRGAFPAGFDRDPELLLDRTTPVAAAEYLRRDPPQGRLWNDMGFGAWLMWALPGVKVNADPRIELYPEAYWLEYLRLSAGPSDSGRRLAEAGISDVLLDAEAQPGLVRYLRASEQWREIEIEGDQALLFRRRAEPSMRSPAGGGKNS